MCSSHNPKSKKPCIFSIANIIKKKKLLEKSYFDFGLQKNREYCFLNLIAPGADFILNDLIRFKSIYPLLYQLFPQKIIIKIIRSYFIKNFPSIISKVCVLEMHEARKNNFLKGSTSQERFNFFIKELTAKNIQIAILNK